MTLPSFREHLDQLKELGELVLVQQEVELDGELPAVIRRVYEVKAPAPLFSSIPGRPGFRVLGAMAGLSDKQSHPYIRTATALGLSVDARLTEIVEQLAQVRGAKDVKPRLLPEGACQENVFTGDDVDLDMLPVPLLHPGDGGRYIGTYGMIIAKTPDGRWTNWSVTRIMQIDKKRMTGLLVPTQHIGMIWQEWKNIGKDMPFALCFGVPPGLMYLAGMPLDAEVNEGARFGGICGKPLDVVKAKTVDIEVPAEAEIVLEGVLSVSEMAPEGPFDEYPGYVAAKRTKEQPVYHVSAITHRNNPIYPICLTGVPVEEVTMVQGVPYGAYALALLREAGISATTAVMVPQAAMHLLAVTVPHDWRSKTGITSSEELGRRIHEVVNAHRVGRVTPRIWILNDDVDPGDLQQLIWAYATRCHPDTGTFIFAPGQINLLVPFLTDEERNRKTVKKQVCTCLTPDENGDSAPQPSNFENYSETVQKKVLDNWSNYGLSPA